MTFKRFWRIIIFLIQARRTFFIFSTCMTAQQRFKTINSIYHLGVKEMMYLSDHKAFNNVGV